MHDLGSTLRTFAPHPNVLAFYDGRIPGVRAWSDARNWLDDGAYSLGVCSYAVVSGSEALVYDAHISLAHAGLIRKALAERGVERTRLVVSHWHTDHVAANAAFADCEIIGNGLTVAALEANRASLAAETPPIAPLVLPTTIFEGSLPLQVGDVAVELRQADIHSHDGTLMLIETQGLLFAGDALEDTVTYVAEPERLEIHLTDLARISGWRFSKILPNHGDPDVIAAGGYGRGLVGATERYVRKLIAARTDPALAATPLADWIADDVAAGHIVPFAPYEEVHRDNVRKVLGAG